MLRDWLSIIISVGYAQFEGHISTNAELIIALGGYPDNQTTTSVALSPLYIKMEETRNSRPSKSEDLKPQNLRRYTMANTQLEFCLMSICILVTQTTKGES